MNCDEIKELLSDYNDHSLPTETYDIVKAHLQSCEACRTEYNQIQKIIKELNSLPEIPLPSGVVFSLETLLANTWDQRTAEQKAEDRKNIPSATEQIGKGKSSAETDKVIVLDEKRLNKENHKVISDAGEREIPTRNGLSDEDIWETAKIFNMETIVNPNIELVSEETVKKQKISRRNRVGKRITLVAAAVAIFFGCYGIFNSASDIFQPDHMLKMSSDLSTKSETSEKDGEYENNSEAAQDRADESTGAGSTKKEDNKGAEEKVGISSHDGGANSDIGKQSDASIQGQSIEESLPKKTEPEIHNDSAAMESDAPAISFSAPEPTSKARAVNDFEESIEPYQSLIERGLRNVSYKIQGYNDSTNTLSLIIISDKNGNSINKNLDLILDEGVVAPADGFETVVEQYWDYS